MAGEEASSKEEREAVKQYRIEEKEEVAEKEDSPKSIPPSYVGWELQNAVTLAGEVAGGVAGNGGCEERRERAEAVKEEGNEMKQNRRRKQMEGVDI